MSWRNELGGHLGRMLPAQASVSLRRIQLRIGLASQPEVCRLTGLKEEELTPFIIQEVCAKLAKRASPPREFDPTEQAP